LYEYEHPENMAEAASESAAPGGRALWDRGFRPFFLAAGIYAVVGVGTWMAIWLGALPAPTWLSPLWWHGHEMVFGFVAAAVAGFLLTAAPVWTGREAPQGRLLRALFALWLVGRVAFLAVGLVPAGLVAVIDAAFLPSLAIVLARMLRGTGQRRNYGIVAVISILSVANVAMHVSALGLVPPSAAGRALRVSVDIVVVLLLVVGGRITPAFTANALRRRGIAPRVRAYAWLDRLVVTAVLALAAADLVAPRGTWSGVLGTVAGVAAGARLAGWQGWAVRDDPLLWSLHAGLGWVAAGLVLVGVSDLGGPVPGAAGLHALTAGAMGTTILAVMTRVGLGHTGRPLVLPKGAVTSYVLAHAAAFLRVTAAFASGTAATWLLSTSSLAWAAAFGLFVLLYWPLLTHPRVDGLPG
jgi:uncharacterized protein involved in response to NO